MCFIKVQLFSYFWSNEMTKIESKGASSLFSRVLNMSNHLCEIYVIRGTESAATHTDFFYTYCEISQNMNGL